MGGVFTQFTQVAEAVGGGADAVAPAALRFVLTGILIFVSGLFSLTDTGAPAGRPPLHLPEICIHL